MGSWAAWSSWSLWRSPALIGLDLGDDSLRLVELQQRRGVLWLCAAGTHALPEGVVVGGDIQQFDPVVAALAQCLQHHPVRTQDVAMALPTDVVRQDTWEAPLGLDDDALAVLVAEHVARRWSADPQSLSLDYGYVLQEPHSDDTPGQVWVAAAPLSLVQDRQGLAQACGLRLTDLECQSRASVRAWQAHTLAAAAAGPDHLPAQPFAGMRLGPRLAAKGWPNESAGYATACGLALRRFMP